jgi:hypothetical protein
VKWKGKNGQKRKNKKKEGGKKKDKRTAIGISTSYSIIKKPVPCGAFMNMNSTLIIDIRH